MRWERQWRYFRIAAVVTSVTMVTKAVNVFIKAVRNG